MSSSPDFSEVERLPGWKTVRPLEKSNFSQTCSLLRQYLKDNGSFGDLSLGITCNLEGKGKSETFRQTANTMNLLPNMEIPGDVSGVSDRSTVNSSRNGKSMYLLPQHASYGPSSVPTEDISKKTDFSRQAVTEPETAQMTIFYAGKVLVFDDFPADKVKEVMLLASKGNSQNTGSFPSISTKEQINPPGFAASGNNSTQERLQKPPQPNVSDLPIARKASLHRFLEKRKDRINARAPYEVNNSAAAPAKPADSQTWLGLASQAS